MTDANPLRDQIRRWADTCSHWKLDERVLQSHDLQRLLEEFKTHEAHRDVYMDIPIESIVSLQRQVGDEGSTWRAAAQELECDRWTEACFLHLDSELRDQAFPTTTTPLQVACHGGAVLVWNGAHRTVAAVVRTLGLGRVDGRLLAVRCHLHPTIGELQDWAIRLWEAGGIDWCHVPAPAAQDLQRTACGRAFELLFRARQRPDQWFGLDLEGRKPFPLPMNVLLACDAVRYMPDIAGAFKPIPNEILRAWRSRAWVSSALR